MSSFRAESPLKRMAFAAPNSHDSDRLSSLPDNVIHHMFRFLGANDTAKLSAVSKRFGQLCFYSPYLFFSADFGPCVSSQRYLGFIKYVDPLLRKRKLLGVELERLGIHYKAKNRGTNAVVNSWIGLAAECGVNELDVLLSVEQWGYYELPKCLQYCKSLRVLRLNLQMGRLHLPVLMRVDSLEEFVMDSVLSAERLVLCSILTWRSLKRLKIQNVDKVDDISITCSSLLENLIISDCQTRRMIPWRLSINGSSFKNLKISRSHFAAEVEITLSSSSLQIVSVLGTKFDEQVVCKVACSAVENIEAYGCCFNKACQFEINCPSVNHIKIRYCDFGNKCEMSTNCKALGCLTVADCELVKPVKKPIDQSKVHNIGVKAEELLTLAINSSDKYSYQFPLEFFASKLQNLRWTGDPVEFMALGLDSFSSLVNASIDIKPSCRHKSEENARRCRIVQSKKFCVANLFESLSHVKTLEINMWPIEIVYAQKDEPIFRVHKLISFENLEQLVLVTDKLLPDQVSAIAYFLERLPNLRMMTVKCDQDLHVLRYPNLLELLRLDVEKFATSAGQVTIARKD